MSAAETDTTAPTEGEATDDAASDAVLTVTEAAITKILELREAEENPSTLALRVSVTGMSGFEYTYDLTFEPMDEAGEGDHLSTQDGLPVLVPLDSIDSLAGATLDMPNEGLVLRNPNRPDPLSGKDLTLTGSVPEQIQQLLTERINPGLAAHGGFARLEGVDGDKAYVTMGGGCQGCAVSAMTLRDGIAQSITDAIPEITEVIDVTDHSAGENPYYS